LNIAGIGWVLAQNLARHFGNVDRLMNASPEEVAEVEGFGPDRAEAVVEWFADEGQSAPRRGAAEHRLRFETGEEETPGRGAAHGPAVRDQRARSERSSREQARAALEALGAKVSENVSKKDGTGVVVGDSPARRSRRRRRRACRSSPRTTWTLCSRRSGERRHEAVLRRRDADHDTG